MKRHELKSKFEVKAVEFLSLAHASPQRSKAANGVICAEQQLRMSTLSAMNTALSFYSELFALIQDAFPEALYRSMEYIDEQSLNILQKCVEMCIPGTTRARAIAYVLVQASGEGYIDDNIEDFVEEFFGGLEDAISNAEREIGGNPYFSYYSSEDEFPAANTPARNPEPPNVS